MSIVSNITTHQCDCCKKQIVIKNERDFGHFEALWYAGLFIDFCTLCQFLGANQTAILKDRAKREHMLNVVARTSADHRPLATDHSPTKEAARAH